MDQQAIVHRKRVKKASRLKQQTSRNATNALDCLLQL